MSIEGLRDARIEEATRDLTWMLDFWQQAKPDELGGIIDTVRRAATECDTATLWEFVFSGVPFGNDIERVINAINS